MTNKIESKYLAALEYDKNLDKSWYAFFIDRTRFTILIIMMIVVAGYLGLKSLPLESNPEINIGIASVIVTLPGASPESMEDLVTKKIEKEIAKIDGIDTITSTSQNSVSAITVQFKSTVNTTEAVRDMKDKVDAVKSQLPSDAKDPIVKEFSFSDTPIWTFSVSGNYDGFALYTYAKKIRDELEKNPLISEVKISGGSETEYLVSIDPKKLENYNLSLTSVNQALQSVNMTMPIGNYDIGDYTHSLSVDERFYNINKIKDIVVTKFGDTGTITLKDIADVKESPKKITSISRMSDAGGKSQNAVTLSVVKKTGGSIVNLVNEGQVALDEMLLKKTIPSDLKITTIVDQSERIKLDLSHLIRDGIITVLLVFITLFLIIGIKEALVAGAAVPLVFLITFTVMAVAGQTLNFLSMFALILSLGLLVDDAIVVISAINQYKKTEKFTTREAAILVLRDYHKVLITTTLTVVWIFSSMLFMTGMIGKFIFSIPFVITITLLASLVIALTINPSLAVMFSGKDDKISSDSIKIRGKSKFKEKLNQALNSGFISLHPLEQFYGKVITYLISENKRVRNLLLGTLLLFFSALVLPISGILKSDFFPKGDADNLYINMEAEAGTKLDKMSKLALNVEKLVLKEKEVSSFSTSIGGLASVGKSSGGSSSSSSNYANISINLIKSEYGRKESSIDIAERLRQEVKNIKDFKVTVVESSSGPPAGGDFELKISGDDFIVLDKISSYVKKTLQTIPGAINIDTSRKALPFEYNFALDNSKLALYDLSIPQVSSFLKNAIDGVESTKIYKGTDEIIVRTKYDTASTDTLDKIKDLKLLNNKGQYVYLRDIVQEKFKASVFSITRIDQERIVSVTASAAKGVTGAQILAEFNKKTANYTLPSGYQFITGGANEENQKSVMSLLIALVFGMIFIIATLILLYDSFRQSVLVLITIPLSLIGVFYGLTLFAQPLSFPGLIGLVALFGIVVRNGIILFDKINQNLGENIPFKESIIDAGMSRLEPVVLTSICTVLGMVPLTLSNPTWTSLGLSIIFGLSVSTVFTLLVLPSLYYMVFKKKYGVK
ncbi:MAG: efflux RND transporter permease subunit [Candidatus Gracilibacteria bacterium]|nr:efflux RND transporter permease subunit [Candidatus Gracilibacteria bacterium]